MRRSIAQKIPAGPGPLWHGICFAPGQRATARTGHLDPLLDRRQWGFPRARRLILLDMRQEHRQVCFWHWHLATLRALHNRDWLPPVTLARKDPVAHAVVDGCFSLPALRQPRHYTLFAYLGWQTIELPGVQHVAWANIGCSQLPIGIFGAVRMRDHFDNR